MLAQRTRYANANTHAQTYCQRGHNIKSLFAVGVVSRLMSKMSDRKRKLDIGGSGSDSRKMR